MRFRARLLSVGGALFVQVGWMMGAFGQATQPGMQPGLSVGSAAPEIKVAKWFKGEPVDRLEKGQVYVVEFWATWCGPCKASMPHVTGLAKKYAGKATFIGISIWEHPKEETEDLLFGPIAKTVEQMGEKMGYNVGAEGLDRFMANAWMKAANQNGIPCAFVVNREGNIAWIGLPANLDVPLEAVVNNTWSISDEQKRVAKVAADDAVRNRFITPILNARKNNDAAGVLAAFDVALANDPNFISHPDFLSIRLDAMLKTNPDAAVSYVESLAAEKGLLTTKPEWVWGVLRVLPLGEKSTGLTTEQYQQLAKALGKVTEAAPNMHHFAAYAQLLDRAGRTSEAVTFQSRAIELAEKSSDPSKLTDWITTQREKLGAYNSRVH